MIKFMQKHYTQEQVKNILSPTVKKWFFSRFKEFSIPQLYGVMEIHSRSNILVSAPTGATKTLTGFLSILNELVDSAEKDILEDKVYCVYISPLKALNNDISKNLREPLEEIEKIADKKLGIRVGVRTGDTETKERTAMLKNPPHILITTPESLGILLASPKFVDHLKKVDWFIADEVHALAENKRGVQLSLTMERLQRLSPGMTRVGLSATIAPLEKVAEFLVGCEDGKPRNCKIVDVQFIKDMDLKVLSPVPDLVDVEHGEMHKKMYELMDKLIQEHKTTLIFTNTRSATERVVHHLKEKFPKHYTEVSETQGVSDDDQKSTISDKIKDGNGTEIFSKIGAHHGSLSKEHRLNIEEDLRKGKLKCVVCSTSLELGIDIGYIDLVIMLSSPKSVARALQRVGRSGHKLHEVTKGRIIVMDRDDLVECAVLLKSGVEKKIDRIHIPENALDVLAQELDGIAIGEKIHIDDMFRLVKQSYCYRNLIRKEFMDVINYLAGEYTSLEDRHVYAKIWYDPETGMVGRRGKMGRVIYMTNIGTIPEEHQVIVKIGEQVVGRIEEAFLEKLKPGDIFVLGGSVYEFKFARGSVAQVKGSVSRPPTVPSWFSEMLPLSFDLAIDIGKFRKLLGEKFCYNKKKKEIMKFIHDYLYIDNNGAESIYKYFWEQFNYAEIPSDTRIIVENYDDGNRTYTVFHSLYGRRVNDCLSRALAFAIGRTQHRNVEIGISDNGFYITSDKKVMVMKAFKMIKSDELHKIMDQAIEKTEIFNRRFRHCANRALMILRNYMGRKKRVGRQQVSSMILMSAVKRISDDFPILKEARREVLEDLMDIDNAKKVVEDIEKKKIKIKEINTTIPSPFAINLITQGHTDIMKIEDKQEFLRRMHRNVMAKLGKKISKEEFEEFNYQEEWDKAEKKLMEEKDDKKEELKKMAWNLKRVPMFAKQEIVAMIDGKEPSQMLIDAVHKYKKEIEKGWPDEIREFVFKKVF
ncbi:MAG: DEAD/DEAH box helicase [Nanoarchaeota archaeon]